MVRLAYVGEETEKLPSFTKPIHPPNLHIFYDLKQMQVYGLTAGLHILIVFFAVDTIGRVITTVTSK